MITIRVVGESDKEVQAVRERLHALELAAIRNALGCKSSGHTQSLQNAFETAVAKNKSFLSASFQCVTQDAPDKESIDQMASIKIHEYEKEMRCAMTRPTLAWSDPEGFFEGVKSKSLCVSINMTAESIFNSFYVSQSPETPFIVVHNDRLITIYGSSHLAARHLGSARVMTMLGFDNGPKAVRH